jgi:single-stranded-DNA-specific exonuclease
MVTHAKSEAVKRNWLGAIVIAHETYHEGVIGLIASKLVDEFYRPAIVLSKGKTVSKASARSIFGFNVIENIRKLDYLLSGGGGHPMAAGFSIESSKIEEFIEEMEKISKELLTDELLQRKLVVDMDLPFSLVNKDLLDTLSGFAPHGLSNPPPLFIGRNLHVEDAVLVGAEKKHIKMKVSDGNILFDSIAFNLGELFSTLSPDTLIDIVYSVEMNYWNGRSTIQLKVKDLKAH